MDSAIEDIKPRFLRRTDKKQLGAAVELSSAEARASEQEPIQTGDGLSGSAANEAAPRGFYSGSGKAQQAKAGKSSSDGNKRSLKSMLKKRGPVAAIIGIFIALTGVMSGAQSLMPVAIEEMIIEKFNSIGISSTMASDNFLNTQLNYGTLTHSEKRGELVNGQQINLFAFSEYQVQQFQMNGIQVVSNISCNNQGVTVLLYRKNSKYNAVVGSDCLGKISNAAIANAAGISESDIGQQLSAKEAFSDPAFKTPYTTASKSWRGGSSGWFDQIMTKITETKLNVKRNRWANWIASEIKDLTKNIDVKFNEIANGDKIDKISDDGVEMNSSFYEDADGNSYTGAYEGSDGNLYAISESGEQTNIRVSSSASQIDGDSMTGISSWAKNVSNNEAFQKIHSVLNSKAMKAASKAAEVGCALIEATVSIYTVVSAYQQLQFLNLISGFLEAVDKVKAGDGDSSPIHNYSENLTTKANTIDPDTGDVVATKSGMDSVGMASLFDGAVVMKNDASLKNVNFEEIMSRLSAFTDNVEITSEVYKACGYAKVAVAGVGLVTTIISFIPFIGQGVKAVEISAKAVIKAGIKIAVSAAFHLLLPVATRKIANSVIKNAATEWFGEDLGNALVSGASKYLGGNGTSGGQSPGSKAKVIAYLGEKNTVIAEEAEYQRSVRSPFDITSHYTFLGSLAYSILPFAYSSGSIMSVLRQASNSISNSVVALLPTASALGINESLIFEQECPLLNSTGAVGDAFCNPYIITDTSTMGYSPEDIVGIVEKLGEGGNQVAANSPYLSVISNNIENGKIVNGSRLSKYITYCGQRTSSYGLKDANIASQVSGSDSTVVSLLSIVAPDITDIATGSIELANLGWISGESCVATDENGSDWESEIKYYQRYAENERLLESIDPNYKSTVTAYLEDYYRENPLDQSLAGTLARFSGMPKEEVEDTLALIEYYQYLDEYDPSERYAFVTQGEGHDEILIENETPIAVAHYDGLQTISIIYNDLRNRNYAI